MRVIKVTSVAINYIYSVHTSKSIVYNIIIYTHTSAALTGLIEFCEAYQILKYVKKKKLHETYYNGRRVTRSECKTDKIYETL